MIKFYLTALVMALASCLSTVAASYSGTLPVMFITTENSTPITSKETYLNATYYLDPMGTDATALGSKDAQLDLQIRGRGNYTWTGFDKKPYRIKFAAKTAILGMKKSKHFALLAHADDNRGFLRNTMGFYVSKTLGMPWTPEQRPVEVVLNGDYIGLYFLTETIRVDKDRVNVVEQPDLATGAEEITGGWLVEIDNYDTDPHVTVKEGGDTNYNIIFTYKTPEELSAEQEKYLTDQMTNLNTKIYSNAFEACPWQSYIDLETLAKFYLTQEIVANYESFHGSCYLSKQQGATEKWMFGPVWDFGSALFPMSDQFFISTDRYYHQVWIGQMCKYPPFINIVKKTWQDFYANSYSAMLEYAESFAESIKDAAAADAKRWPQYGNPDEMARCADVLSWLRTRCTWLRKQWGGTNPDAASATVYYVDYDQPNPWAQVNVYTWGETGTEFNGKWPGSPMTANTLDGHPAWAYTFDDTENMTGNVGLIFNNGQSGAGNQTGNLVYVAGGIYHRDGTMGADDITASADETPVYYNLQGQRVDSPVPGTLYIERTASKARKVIY